MHMADALISPAVGGALWATSAGLTAYSAACVKKNLADAKIPLMGVLGAFVFASQMINFAIPATGSSGHLGGGLLLAILLGPYAGFLTIASILTIQALFFADGGLLALGCNIFNLGFFPCFIAYPFIYKPLTGKAPSSKRLFAGITLAAITGLQLGAFGVVLETTASGISELPFTAFVLLMQPIHLAIGLVEGLVSAAVVLFLFKERPDLVINSLPIRHKNTLKPILLSLLLIALLTGGVLSPFASEAPDGLEWSISAITGQEELSSPEGIHTVLAELQKKTAFFPDYSFKEVETPAAATKELEKEKSAWLTGGSGTSLAGIIGSLLTLLLAFIIAKGIKFAAKHS